jgi:hypothetical protein
MATSDTVRSERKFFVRHRSREDIANAVSQITTHHSCRTSSVASLLLVWSYFWSSCTNIPGVEEFFVVSPGNCASVIRIILSSENV